MCVHKLCWQNLLIASIHTHAHASNAHQLLPSNRNVPRPRVASVAVACTACAAALPRINFNVYFDVTEMYARFIAAAINCVSACALVSVVCTCAYTPRFKQQFDTFMVLAHAHALFVPSPSGLRVWMWTLAHKREPNRDKPECQHRARARARVWCSP